MDVNVFNYGSNGIVQLRQRLDAPALTAKPATLPGYTRVFCLSAVNWADGGVASLAPAPADGRAPVRGSVVTLSAAQAARLDGFEGTYRRERLTAVLDGAETPVIAYVAGDGTQGWTPAMDAPPSEMYLTAIRLHLRSVWGPGAGDEIAVRSFEGGRVVERGSWSYPGVEKLCMEGLLVEANRICTAPWVDGGKEKKARVVETARALRSAGVLGAADLKRLGAAGLNAHLVQCGEAPVAAEMVDALLQVCQAKGSSEAGSVVAPLAARPMSSSLNRG